MIDKRTKASLSDKHILCFGTSPAFYIQTPLRIEWFGAYSSLHGSSRLTSAVNVYMNASVSQNNDKVIRIISKQYPAINIALDKPMDDYEKGSSSSLIQQLIYQVKQIPIQLNQGLSIFIDHETKHQFQYGFTSGFLLTVLEAIVYANKNKMSIKTEEKIKILSLVEHQQMPSPFYLSDALSMVQGGMNLYESDSHHDPIYQSNQDPITQFKVATLSIQHYSFQANLSMKNIVEQMNIISQHYQQKRLIDVDPLTFYHQERDLSLLYGTKAIAKVKHFFQEHLATKQAYLALEKEDEHLFFKLFKQAQLRDFELLEHHQVINFSENKIGNIIKWLSNAFPDIAFRLHGFGFQADFVLFIPNTLFPDIFKRIKKQFYQEQIRELHIVKRGIRVFKA